MIFVLGYFSGHRHAVSDAVSSVSSEEEENEKFAKSPRGPETHVAVQDTPKTVEPDKKEKKQPRRLEDLPPAFLDKFREAAQFLDRIPEMERELLVENPLLRKALKLEEGFQQSESDWKHNDKILEEWSRKSSENKYKVSMRKAILRLKTYLELADDPKYKPFVEDGLKSGKLSEDIAILFQRHLGDAGGLDFEGVDLIGPGITDIQEFRSEFRRFTAAIQAIPENQFAFEPLSRRTRTSGATAGSLFQPIHDSSLLQAQRRARRLGIGMVATLPLS